MSQFNLNRPVSTPTTTCTVPNCSAKAVLIFKGKHGTVTASCATHLAA